MTQASPTAIRPAPKRLYNPVQKDYATFLETSEGTNGARTLIEVEVAPGGGNKPHYHRTYAEHFQVLRGRLTVRLGNEARVLGPGEEATVPPNALHCFSNPTGEPTTFLVEMRPGQPGFEKAITAGYGLAEDGLTFRDGIPRNPYRLAVLLEWSSTRVPGVFTLLELLFRLLTRRARRLGIDRELEARYCR